MIHRPTVVLLSIMLGSGCGGAIQELPDLCGRASDGTNPDFTLVDVTKVEVRPPTGQVNADGMQTFGFTVWGKHNDPDPARVPLICGAVFGTGFAPLAFGFATASTGVQAHDFRAEGEIAVVCTPGGHLRRLDGGGAWHAEGDAFVGVVVKKPIAEMFVGAQVHGVGQSYLFHLKCGPPLATAAPETLDLSGPGQGCAGGGSAETVASVAAALLLWRRRSRVAARLRG